MTLKSSTLEMTSISKKSLKVNFDGGHLSSDGGLLLLREVENQVGIIRAMANVIPDHRDTRYIKHTLFDLLIQRVAQIAAGYEDANDCNDLRDDPIFKMIADRFPEADHALASQPTMTRFENSPSRTTLYRLAVVFVEAFFNSYLRPPKVIVLDLDDTESILHGQQQLSLFNGYFNEYCYMPLHVYEGLSGKLITTILKPGKRLKGSELLPILKRLVAAIRQRWPQTLIIIRGDSHFTGPELMEWRKAQPFLQFVTGLGINSRLKSEVAAHLERAQKYYKMHGQKVTLFHSFYYQAKSWPELQRVVAKIEVSKMGSNVRFIVTSLEHAKASVIYKDIYCARGNDENYIKDHKLYLKSDRASCHRFEANQFRLWLHSAAYVLLHTLRSQILQHTSLAKATISTIRLKLFKIAARVRELKTQIQVELPSVYPLKELFSTVCLRLEAARAAPS